VAISPNLAANLFYSIVLASSKHLSTASNECTTGVERVVFTQIEHYPGQGDGPLITSPKWQLWKIESLK